MDAKKNADAVITRIKSVVGVKSDKELAMHFGYGATTITSKRQRGSIPYDEALQVALATGISLDWLILGKGEAPSGTAHGAGSPLPTISTPSQIEGNFSAIPIYDIEAAAGVGRLFDDELVETTIQFDTEQLQRDGLDPSQVVGVRVRGDSMGETLHDGDRVLVDRSSRTPDGVFLLRMDDGLRIKRVQRVAGGGWMLISDNSRYQPELVDPLSNQNVEIIGECVMRLGRIS